MSGMFCYQCEQTAGGKGCTKAGVCGKDAEVAALQDLLLHELKGIGYYGQKVLAAGGRIEASVHQFVMEAIFATLTNVNFDAGRFVLFLREAAETKRRLRDLAGGDDGKAPAAAKYELPATKEAMLADATAIGIMSDANLDPDIRSLRETLIYSLKGMGAYAHHAAVLGYTNEDVSNFFYKGLAASADDSLGADELLQVLMDFGMANLKCLELLDKANTGSYGHPQPTQVLITKKKGPVIVVSGHDLKDLKELLEQTEGKGINIYTHGEMLPAHGYPELKKHKHLTGNFGSAWQNQAKEFDHLPGCVLMTTNCIQRPRESYKDRIYTTGVVGWPDVKHIQEKDGRKDFSPLIEQALSLGGWTEDEPEKSITVGFGHNAVLSNAGAVIEGVKQGKIKHFFLIGGCDGVKQERSYYTDFAARTPADTVILTLGCGKYRFNKEEFGTIGGLPRLLDLGQCNDAYSALKIALALADAFNCEVNDLPLTLVLSWYEQKAIAILMTLLALGIKNIYIGPSLPAFVSPNVLNILVEKFNLRPVSTPEADLGAILKS
jgi:hydroxylamine reductase